MSDKRPGLIILGLDYHSYENIPYKTLKGGFLQNGTTPKSSLNLPAKNVPKECTLYKGSLHKKKTEIVWSFTKLLPNNFRFFDFFVLL